MDFYAVAKNIFAVEVLNNKFFFFTMKTSDKMDHKESEKEKGLKHGKCKCSILEFGVPFIAGFIYFAFLRIIKPWRRLKAELKDFYFETVVYLSLLSSKWKTAKYKIHYLKDYLQCIRWAFLQNRRKKMTPEISARRIVLKKR